MAAAAAKSGSSPLKLVSNPLRSDAIAWSGVGIEPTK